MTIRLCLLTFLTYRSFVDNIVVVWIVYSMTIGAPHVIRHVTCSVKYKIDRFDNTGVSFASL